MLPILIIALIAVGIFIYFRNRQENRRVDRQNRIQEKQEELLELLRRTDSTKTNEDE